MKEGKIITQVLRYFLRFFLGKNVFSHPPQLRVHHFAQLSMTFSTISSSKMFHHFFLNILHMLQHLMFVKFFSMSKIVFNMHSESRKQYNLPTILILAMSYLPTISGTHQDTTHLQMCFHPHTKGCYFKYTQKK